MKIGRKLASKWVSWQRLGVFLGFLLGTAACTSNSSNGPSASSLKMGSKGEAASKVLHLAIWSNYVTPELLKEFEKRTGISVDAAHYSSNEELLAKLQAGASGYDVVVPSDYMVQAMVKLGMLHRLDLTKIPNATSLQARYLKRAFDPSNEYSLPYDAGTTGIAINRDLYRGTIKGWKDFFNHPDLAGKFSVLDDVHEVIGAALKSMGYSINSRDTAQLTKAKELLVKIRPGIKFFNSETLTPLVNGEVAVAQAFVMDALQARKATGGKIEYVLPEEGGSFYIDNLTIPAASTHVAEAHALINFLLEPKVGARLSSSLFLAPANGQSLALLPAGFMAANPGLFPSEEALTRFETLQDMGDAARVLDRIWTDLKASL